MKEHPILVVDDDVALLALITEVLESEGYSVVQAQNGAQAIRAVSDARPSVALLDMQMPVFDGWEFIELVRANGLRFPIVIMTGSHDAPRWAAEVGADDYLGKPFALDDLLSKVAHFSSASPGEVTKRVEKQ